MLQKKSNQENSWHFLCHKSEISKNGNYVNTPFFDKEIFVLNEKKSINVYENLCMHRGSKLVDSPSGKWDGRCPYHGVCYVKGNPINLEEKGLQRSKERISLNKFKIGEVGDFIFFTEFSNNDSIENFLGDTTFNHLKNISLNIDELISDSNYTYDCRWEVAIENALEPLHLEDIHPETLNTLDLGPSMNQEFENSIIFDHELNNQQMKKGLEKMKFFFKHSFNETYQSTYIFPYFFVSTTYGFSFSIQTFFPSNDVFKTNFRSRIYTSKLNDGVKKGVLKSFFDSSIEINKKIFKEDASICSRINKTPNHFIGPIADTEEKILWFRKRLKKN